MSKIQAYFEKYRNGIIGSDMKLETPYHESIRAVYTDWTASGRMYAPLEERLSEMLFPYVANPHTETSSVGQVTTLAYQLARKTIKDHVGAGPNDVLICYHAGMTAAVNKFQRILGLKIHEDFENCIKLEEVEKPVVFVTHMEHHSNQTSWEETIADVVVVPPNDNGLVCLEKFREAIGRYPNRKRKYAAITSCSNVTGIMTPYMDIAEIIHEAGGYCFTDFACSAPYIDINMNEDREKGRYLDAIYFSPHKFLGGPGSAGVLIFNQDLYHLTVPDTPGGGTVEWTNPWGGHQYIKDIEIREDGGTPAFLQTIKTALCCKLKEEIGTDKIAEREKEIVDRVFDCLGEVNNLHILADKHRKRLPVISFYIDGLHYDLGVRLLNDLYGIQTRGGCSCAGTYGHFLLNVDQDHSRSITDMITTGDCSLKPGWIRMSFHPTSTDEEVDFVCNSVKDLAARFREYQSDYEHDYVTGKIEHKKKDIVPALIKCAERLFEPFE